MYYPIAIEAGDDTHAYGVVVPDLPGCFSAGDSFEDALKNAHEAIELHLEGLFEDGLEIPQASDMKQHIADPEFKGWVWAMVEVDITPFLGKSQKVNVTLPEVLIKRIDAVVGSQPTYKTRSGFLAQAAIHELSKLSAV